MRWIQVCWVALAILVMGCGRAIQAPEIADMSKMNEGWAKDIAPFQDVLREAAATHREVMAGVDDTASVRYKAMRSDSLGRLRLSQADEKYSRWFSTAEAQLKRLQGLITTNRDWFRRLPTTGTSLLHARRSWDARREEFYALYQSCKAQIALFPEYQASFVAFKPASAAPVVADVPS